MIAPSSHTFPEWLAPLEAGVSPHNNSVRVVVVGDGFTGEVPDGRKAYWAGNVEVSDSQFVVRSGGLVIVNAEERVVFLCPA